MSMLASQEQMRFVSEKIVLVGDPRRCQGVVQVHNPTKDKVRLRRLLLTTRARELMSACNEPGQIEVKVSGPLCAGETQGLRAIAKLPLGTPPGVYEACIESPDGAARPVSIHVLERRAVKLSPPGSAYTVQAGTTFCARFSATNLGNVAVRIPARVLVELHTADYGWSHYFHRAARARGEEGHAAFLDAFVRGLSRQEPPTGRAKVVQGAGELAPQETRLLELSIALPKSLRNRRNYQGIVRIGTARHRMRLHVSEPEVVIT
jgi:hypothetical protein